ncbi:transposase family protein [Nonomuraea jabiensis]|uniref:transposase family protein n=1 Tax=Nonomuraea jabiensis TaxID=882448 RepID=UPI00367F6BA0
MPSSPIDVLARHLEHVAVANPPTDLLDLPTLAEILDALPDPRSRRGRRYRLGPLLALSLFAVLGGATSLAKIARFTAGYDPDLRARAGIPGTVRLASSTLGRLLTRLRIESRGSPLEDLARPEVHERLSCLVEHPEP